MLSAPTHPKGDRSYVTNTVAVTWLVDVTSVTCVRSGPEAVTISVTSGAITHCVLGAGVLDRVSDMSGLTPVLILWMMELGTHMVCIAVPMTIFLLRGQYLSSLI